MEISDAILPPGAGAGLSETILHWLPVVAAIAASGAVGGLLAGLLGVGGGIVIVPVLDAALEFAGVQSGAALHIAVATSMATIVPTALSSSRSHAKRGSVDLELMKRWSVPVVLGSLAGALLAARLDARVVAAVFGCVALAAALKMLMPLDHVVLRSSVPGGLGGASIPAAIGAISAMMGIGGGTLSVPTMTLCGMPVHKAVGTAALTGLWISVPATVGYLLAPAADVTGMPLTIGYVSLLGFAIIAPVSWVVAPLGVRLAHALDRRRLSAAFGLFLALVAARMLHRAFA
jgi:uncharacterized membrane protein YfcA